MSANNNNSQLKNQNQHLPTISSHSSSLVDFDHTTAQITSNINKNNNTNNSKKSQEKRTKRTNCVDGDDDDEDASICELSHENSQEQLNQNSRQTHKDPSSSSRFPVASTTTATANLPFNADDFEKAFKRQMEQMLEGVDATEMVMMKPKQALPSNSHSNSATDVFAAGANAMGQSQLPPLSESKNMKSNNVIQDRRALLLAKQQRKEAKLMAIASAGSKSANQHQNDNKNGNDNTDRSEELTRAESLGSIVPINNTSSSSPRQQILSVSTPQLENVPNNNNVPVSSAIALSNSSKKPSFVSGNIPKKASTSDFVPTAASQSNDDNNKIKQLTTSRRPSVVVFAHDNDETANFSPNNNNNNIHQHVSPISTNQNQIAMNNNNIDNNNHFSPSIVIPIQPTTIVLSPTTNSAIKEDIFEIEYGNSDFSSPSSFGPERVRELLHERADDEVFELIRKSKMKEEQEEEEYLQRGNDVTTASGEEPQQKQQIFSTSYARQNPQSRGHHHHHNINNNNNQEGAGALSAIVAPVNGANSNNEDADHQLGQVSNNSNNNMNKTDENGKKLTVAELKEKKRQQQIEETRRRVLMRTNSDAGSSAVTRSTMNNGNSSNNNNNSSSSSVASRQKRGKNSASPNARRGVNASSDEDDDDDSGNDDDEGKCCFCFDSIDECVHAFTPSWASWVSFFWMVFLPGFFYVTWLGLFRSSGQNVCEAGVCVCSEGASVGYAFTIGLIINLPRSVFFAILLEMIRKNRSDAPLRKVRVWLLAIMSVFVSIAVEAIVGTVAVSDAAYQAARYIAVVLPTLVYGILKGNTLIGIGVSILAANPLATDLINPLYSRGGGDNDSRNTNAGGLRYLLLLWPFLMLVADRFVTHVLFMLLPTKLKLASSLAVSYVITSFFQMVVLVACFDVDTSSALAVLYPIAVAACEFLHSLHMVDVFFTTIFSYIQEWLSYLFEMGKELLAAFGVEGVSGIDDTNQANMNNNNNNNRSSKSTNNNQQRQKNTSKSSGNRNSAAATGSKNPQLSSNGTTVSIPNNNNNNNNNKTESIDAFSLRSAATAGNSSISAANNDNNQNTAAKCPIFNQSEKTKNTSNNNNENHANSENSSSPTTMIITSSINNNNNDSISSQRATISPATPLVSATTTGSSQTQKRIRPKFYTNDLRLMGTNCRLICLFLVAFVATLQLLIERYPKKYNFSTCQGEMKSTENMAFWWRNLGVVCFGQLAGQILATLVRWYQMRSDSDGMLELMVKLKYAISFFPIPGRFLPVLTGMTIANVYVQVLLSIT